MGPIAREQLREGLHRQVTRSVEAGATLVMGGEMPDGEGFFYPVTMLTGVEPGMAACTEETFGPIAVVIAADDAEHALTLANDTPYGLGAAIWTETERGVEMARRIEAGQVSDQRDREVRSSPALRRDQTLRATAASSDRTGSANSPMLSRSGWGRCAAEPVRHCRNDERAPSDLLGRRPFGVSVGLTGFEPATP